MGRKNKVVWSEGMFLQPQHFQQHDRYLQSLVNGRCVGLRPNDWGFYNLIIDQAQLEIGKFALTECRGKWQDGTPFNLPDDDPLPMPLDIGNFDNVRDAIVYLALPGQQAGSIEASDDNAESMARYTIDELEVTDSTNGSDNSAVVQTGNLRTAYMMENQERSGHVCLGVARIIEIRADKTVILDRAYVPANLNCADDLNISSYIDEIHGLLATRSEALGGRISDTGRGSVAEITDFLLLQVVNRYIPLFDYFSNLTGLHPASFYEAAVQLAGELATFTRTGKRAPSFPEYRQDDLDATFVPVMEELRRSLSMVLEQNAIPIPLSKPKYGVYAARIPDRNLLQAAIFVLAAHADVSPDLLRSRFPSQIKIGPVEKIKRLVQSALPGISVVPLPVAPRQIPYHAGFSYFELGKEGRLWVDMNTSGGLAIHIGGDFPGLRLELWAIKSG